jgi:hypothetical protein
MSFCCTVVEFRLPPRWSCGCWFGLKEFDDAVQEFPLPVGHAGDLVERSAMSVTNVRSLCGNGGRIWPSGLEPLW